MNSNCRVFIRLPQQIRDFSLVLFEITVSRINEILHWVSVLYADPFSGCLQAVEKYIKCVTSIFIVPFAYYYESNGQDHGPNRGIPMLSPAHGYRKLLTCFVHLIVVIRTCWTPLVFNQKLEAKYHGMFTSDLCFVATISLTAMAMIVIWLKTWRHTAVIHGIPFFLRGGVSFGMGVVSGSQKSSSFFDISIRNSVLDTAFQNPCRSLHDPSCKMFDTKS